MLRWKQLHHLFWTTEGCCIIRDPIKQSCCYAHPYTYAHSLRRTKRKPDNAFHGHPHFNAGIQQTSLCTDRNASLHKELQPPSDIYTAYSALSRPLWLTINSNETNQNTSVHWVSSTRWIFSRHLHFVLILKVEQWALHSTSCQILYNIYSFIHKPH